MAQQGMWLTRIASMAGIPNGASHCIGYLLGGGYGVPHGITSCVALPAVLTWNEAAGTERQALVAELMGKPGQSAADAVRSLAHGLGLPTDLKTLGIGPDKFQAIAEHTMHDGGVRVNPRPIKGPEDIVEILEIAAG